MNNDKARFFERKTGLYYLSRYLITLNLCGIITRNIHPKFKIMKRKTLFGLFILLTFITYAEPIDTAAIFTKQVYAHSCAFGLQAVYVNNTGTMHYTPGDRFAVVLLEGVSEVQTNYASIIELVTLILFLVLVYFKRILVFKQDGHPGGVLFWYTVVLSLFSGLFIYELLRTLPAVIPFIAVIIGICISAMMFIYIGIIDTPTGSSRLLNFWNKHNKHRFYALFIMLCALIVPFVGTFGAQSEIFIGFNWIKVLLFIFFIVVRFSLVSDKSEFQKTDPSTQK